MAGSLQAVKRKIASTKKTKQITSAMQMVSTSKLNQIQHHTTSYREYADKVRSVITHLAKSHLLDAAAAGSEDAPAEKKGGLGMLTQRPVQVITVISLSRRWKLSRRGITLRMML